MHYLFYRQNAAVGVHRKKSPDGLYLTYYPFGDLRDVRLMPRYHAKTRSSLQYYPPHSQPPGLHRMRELQTALQLPAA